MLGPIENLNSRGEVGSGKFDTPCERMQRANLTASCWNWACVTRPTELDGLREFEPHAAITATAITARATGRPEAVLNMTQVITGGGSHECNTPAPTRIRPRLE